MLIGLEAKQTEDPQVDICLYCEVQVPLGVARNKLLLHCLVLKLSIEELL